MSGALSPIPRSDRKTAQLLAITITRDPSAHTPHDSNNTRRKRFPFRLCLGNKHAPDANRPAPVDEEPSCDGSDDPFVRDVSNPFVFVPPDPTNAPLHSLIQAEVARTRRYEPVHHDVDSEDEHVAYNSDQDDEGYDSEYEDDSHGNDADDEDEDSDDDLEDVDKPNVIALPQLLPKVSLCFIMPTTLFYPSSEFEDEDLEDTPAPYNDVAEAEERAARKAKRDAHRSRSKALAISAL